MPIEGQQIIRWNHHKGGCYMIVGFGIDEASMEPEVYYRQVSLIDNKATGPTWSRRCSVFFDGRFKQSIDTKKVKVPDAGSGD